MSPDEYVEGYMAELEATWGPPSKSTKLVLTPASSYTPRAHRWLVPGMIPRGALTLLSGREGLGKSTWAYTLAAAVTRGTVPGDLHGRPADVFIAATEDDWPTTIVPRLMAAGADLGRVHNAIDVIRGGPGGESVLTFPEDGAALAAALAEHEVALLILDPLLPRIGKGYDTHKDQPVRQGLAPLVEAAGATRTAVLGIIHRNKSEKSDLADTTMGSRAFTAVARSVLAVLRHPENPDLRLIGAFKANAAKDTVSARVFEIRAVEIGQDPDDGMPISGTYAEDLGSYTASIAEANAAGQTAAGPRANSLQAEAEIFLARTISAHGGSVSRPIVFAENENRGSEAFSPSALTRAADSLNVTKSKPGFQGTGVWSTPSDGWPSRVKPYMQPDLPSTRRVRITRRREDDTRE
jgi:hypothetical protein